jgi:hypothetical protein
MARFFSEEHIFSGEPPKSSSKSGYDLPVPSSSMPIAISDAFNKPFYIADTLENDNFFFNFNTVSASLLTEFGNFDFRKLIGSIVQIGKESNSGFVNLLRFKENTKEFNCILKTTKKISADNNYYEFLVGICINKLKEYFPNFQYTFNYYILPDITITTLKSPSGKISQLKETTFPVVHSYAPITDLITSENLEKGCLQNDKSSILCEAITNSISMKEYLNNIDNISLHEIINILIQIYKPLTYFSSEFTHYDLHLSNVLLKKVPTNKYIEVRYESETPSFIEPQEPIVLKTKYIPVIIDYGRSYINCEAFDGDFKRRDIANRYCNNKCNTDKPPSCEGRPYGLGLRRNRRGDPDISEKLRNIEVYNTSQDNRFIFVVLDTIINIVGKNPSLNSEFSEFLKLRENFNYDEWRARKFYVPEKSSLKLNKIVNIFDTLNWLEKLYYSLNLNVRDLTEEKYGTIVIKSDKKWEFIPS